MPMGSGIICTEGLNAKIGRGSFDLPERPLGRVVVGL